MLKLTNTLTKKLEPFHKKPGDTVLLYCCGPTVYDYAQIGNFRTYVVTDVLVRTLRYLGYTVRYVMNITDVGHLTSDSDTGDDKMEKGAKREGRTAWDIAEFYTRAFLEDSKALNLIEPDARPKPTDHIKEQIAMVKTLLDKGFAYTIDDGIYFDTSKSKHYGILTHQNRDELKAGARVETNPQKRNPLDFALWKFSYPKGRPFNPASDTKRRDMEWDSPWGLGFPGWHIECSAMSMSLLHANQLDIHTGGVDLIPIHHTNEIAQAEAATGIIPFVRCWVHGQFLTVDGEKMSKSKHNFYRLSDITDKGYDPLDVRYFYLTAHYRSYLNFTWVGLTAAQRALDSLRKAMQTYNNETVSKETLLSEQAVILKKQFQDSLEDDLNVPKALSVVWEIVKSSIPSNEKQLLLHDADSVLGLNLEAAEKISPVPKEIIELVNKRNAYRRSHNYDEADIVRKRIEELGFVIEDTNNGVAVKKLQKKDI